MASESSPEAQVETFLTVIRSTKPVSVQAECTVSVIKMMHTLLQNAVSTHGCTWPFSAYIALWVLVRNQQRQGMTNHAIFDAEARKGFNLATEGSLQKIQQVVHDPHELAEAHEYINTFIKSNKLLHYIFELAAGPEIDDGRNFDSLWQRLRADFPHHDLMKSIDQTKIPDFAKLELLRHAQMVLSMKPRISFGPFKFGFVSL